MLRTIKRIIFREDSKISLLQMNSSIETLLMQVFDNSLLKRITSVMWHIYIFITISDFLNVPHLSVLDSFVIKSK